MSRNPRWNPATRHTMLGEPGNAEFLASKAGGPRFSPVPIVSSGPQTFRCCQCLCKIVQDPDREEPNLEPRRGTVYADLDGTAFVDYYCHNCKASQESPS